MRVSVAHCSVGVALIKPSTCPCCIARVPSASDRKYLYFAFGNREGSRLAGLVPSTAPMVIPCLFNCVRPSNEGFASLPAPEHAHSISGIQIRMARIPAHR